MLFSISVLLLLGMSLGALCKKLHLPALTGMLITGIFLGPYALDLIDASILSVSADLRRIALIIILIRAGLSLNLDDLKKVGRPAILMCFVPACFEMAGMILLAPKLLGISLLDAAILSSVIAAVSPAVIVPNMVKLMEEGYGTKKGIPQLILAGASVDDVFVIVVFTAFTSLAAGDSVSIRSFVNIPISIFLGIISGLGIGLLLSVFFHRIHMRDTAKVIIFLCISFLLVTLEDHCANVIPFASLIAVMTIGVSLQQKNQALSEVSRRNRCSSAPPCSSLSDVRCLSLSCRNRSYKKRTTFLHDSLHSKGNRPGSYRWNPSRSWTFLRKSRPHRCRCLHTTDSTAWSLLYRKQLSKTFDPLIFHY